MQLIEQTCRHQSKTLLSEKWGDQQSPLLPICYMQISTYVITCIIFNVETNPASVSHKLQPEERISMGQQQYLITPKRTT